MDGYGTIGRNGKNDQNVGCLEKESEDMFVVMYHYVRNIQRSRYPDIKGLEKKMFQQQLDFFTQEGFEFIGMKTLLEEPEKITDKSILLTFDDGYQEHYNTVFPILDAQGIEGFFSMPGKIIKEQKALDVNKIHFILATTPIEQLKTELFQLLEHYRGSEFDYPSNLELYEKTAIANRFDTADTIFVKRTLQVELPEALRNIITEQLFQKFVTKDEAAFVDELYMDMDQVRTMKKHGMSFGFHGYEHHWLNRLTESELREDIAQGLEVFEGVFDTNNWCCCYPYGSYSSDVIRVVKEMGGTSGFSTEVREYQPNRDDIFAIPRLDTNDFPPKSEKFREFSLKS